MAEGTGLTEKSKEYSEDIIVFQRQDLASETSESLLSPRRSSEKLPSPSKSDLNEEKRDIPPDILRSLTAAVEEGQPVANLNDALEHCRSTFGWQPYQPPKAFNSAISYPPAKQLYQMLRALSNSKETPPGFLVWALSVQLVSIGYHPILPDNPYHPPTTYHKFPLGAGPLPEQEREDNTLEQVVKKAIHAAIVNLEKEIHEVHQELAEMSKKYETQEELETRLDRLEKTINTRFDDVNAAIDTLLLGTTNAEIAIQFQSTEDEKRAYEILFQKRYPFRLEESGLIVPRYVASNLERSGVTYRQSKLRSTPLPSDDESRRLKKEQMELHEARLLAKWGWKSQK